MSNFYGKRFFSSLLGALSVLSSPVASAVGGRLGKGNLKGEVESSAGRSKNGGKGGELEADRKVKGIDGLKKVLKETGGKVVRVSPDGKGGFVAFVNTPTGKVVTLAVVGVSLIAIITFLAVLHSHRRKSNESSEEIVGDVEDGPLDSTEKNTIENMGIGGSTNENLIDSKQSDIVKVANGDLLSKLFGGSRKKYGLFVDKLLEDFFKGEHFKEIFNDCDKNLDEFLSLVFKASNFEVDGELWKIVVDDDDDPDLFCLVYRRSIFWGKDVRSVNITGASSDLLDFLVFVLWNSSEVGLVGFSKGRRQANWGEKISAMLFGFWFLAEYNLEPGSSKVREYLGEKGIDNFREIFKTIRDYVKNRLSAAGRDDNGQ